MARKEKRFVVHSENLGLCSAKILMDKLTGVHYIYFTDGCSGGLTVLLDENGKPFIQPVTDDDEP